MRTQNTSPLRFWFSTLLAGAALGLVGCGGSNKDHHDDHHDHDHDSDHRGRLIFSTSNSSNLGVFDQAQNVPGFLANGFSRSGGVNSQLILSQDGLSIAVLDGTELTILSSGLEHLNGDHSGHGHTHEIEQKGQSIADIQKVIATQGYFAVLDNAGSSHFVDVNGVSKAADTGVIYPSLLLENNHRLKFTTANSKTIATVIDADRHEIALAETIECDSIKQTVQTVHLTAVLCNDKNLYWVATEHNNNGFIVNGKQAAKSGTALTGFDGLLIASIEDDTIAAYSNNQLWLLAAHGDHIHSTDASTAISGKNIIQAAALSDNETITLLADDGTITFVNFDVDHGTALVKGQPSIENITSNSTIDANQLQLIAGAESLWIINKSAGELYSFDAHDDQFHQHGKYENSDLTHLHSAVFAHYIETEDDHDGHDHDDHDHDNHDHDHDH